jgi:uncharacterized repeat protein (TIGR01451 family)
MEYFGSAFRGFEPRNSRRACAVLLAIMLVFGPGLASAAVDKTAAHQEMAGLATQMKTLKPQIGTNPQSAATYGSLASRYLELSSALGGDDPGQVLHGGGAAAAQAPTTEVVPTTPAGCSPATATFTQSTPTAIPTGPAVVTSTVVVSGAGPYLFDLDLTTNLTHTFAADLDITLTSPAGTVVTLTTDNGAGNDNVFNGTLWDDDANPAGQVPYTTNAGLVTDHPYVNLTTATPLVPEENFGAFIGEDPNGTWTITISDDLAGDGGSLDSWSLAVTTFASAPTTANTTATQSTPTAIPTGPAVVTSTLVVAGAGTSILDVDLTTFLTHTFAADLDITLQSPAGTVVTLTTDNGAGNDNVFNGTVWDDDANPAGQVPYTTNAGLVTDHPYVNLTTATPLDPEEAMAAFIGEDPNGTWTITISDDLAGDGGSLDSWTLDIDTFTCASADLSITKDDGVTSVAAGGMTTYTIVASNAGPTAANPVSVTDTFPAFCTSVSYTSVAAGGATGNTAGPAAGNINDAALNLPAGSSVTYTAICTISAGASGTLVNTATISSATPDPNPANNSATDTDTITVSADLVLTKVPNTTIVNVGSNVVYTLTVTNNGPAPATGVTVTDPATPGLTYVSNSCGAPNPANPVADPFVWSVGNLAVSASASCMVTYTVTQAGPIVNTATATGNEADPTPADATSTVTITGVITTPGIPTLSEVGLLLLALMLAGMALMVMRRRRA